MENTNKIVKKFNIGGISAVIWNNETLNDKGEIVNFKSVSFERKYFDKNTQEWKPTNTLRIIDLPKAILVLNKAYEYILLNQDEE